MQSYRSLDPVPASLQGGAVTVGNFDGVHLGHRRIIERLKAKASEVGGPAVVFTFDPRPDEILRPHRVPPPLTTTERKAELLGELGVDGLIVYPADAQFVQLGPRDFLDRMVRGVLRARAVVEGPHFFFGHQREGNTELLGRWCRESGVLFEVVEPVRVDGQVVSSSGVRQLLAAGRIDEASRRLGRPYRMVGRVIHGVGRGATIGFPTANLGEVTTLIPAEGIYAGQAVLEDQSWPAAISIGPNPTFGEGALKIEAHLVGYEGTLYGRRIAVDFLARLRNIRRFPSVDELVAQMGRDVAIVRALVEQCVHRPAASAAAASRGGSADAGS